jgi:hypothetical protein
VSFPKYKTIHIVWKKDEEFKTSLDKMILQNQQLMRILFLSDKDFDEFVGIAKNEIIGDWYKHGFRQNNMNGTFIMNWFLIKIPVKLFKEEGYILYNYLMKNTICEGRYCEGYENLLVEGLCRDALYYYS